MVAMAQRLDARSFFFHTQLSVSTFLALVLKICRNRFRCHGQSVPELSLNNLCSFAHSLTIHGPHEEGGGSGTGFVSQKATVGRSGLVDVRIGYADANGPIGCVASQNHLRK
jgi:hypothetical protein